MLFAIGMMRKFCHVEVQSAMANLPVGRSVDLFAAFLALYYNRSCRRLRRSRRDSLARTIRGASFVPHAHAITGRLIHRAR
jgi:hypothetical protein